MSKVFGERENKRQMIKGLIRQLRTGANPEEIKEKSEKEEELIKEGMPIEGEKSDGENSIRTL